MTVTKQKLYIISAFTVGFSTMVLELIATRILAPMIGSSIYTWTSDIGIILLGLALGNIFGGKYIDRHNSRKSLFLIYALTAISISAIPFIASFSKYIVLLPISLPILTLTLTIVMFFLPSFFIGGLYPCIFKFYLTDITTAGEQSGRLSGIWSLGSIVGTFLTGFFFISNIGSFNTIYTISIILFANGLFFADFKRRFSIFAFLLIIFFSIVSSHIATLHKDKNLLLNKESRYYNIKVIKNNTHFTASTKMMFLDFDLHSIEREDGKNINIYTNLPPLFFQINSKLHDILILGGGAESISKKFASFFNDSVVTSVEIDPEVAKVAADIYGNEDNSHINTEISDGRMFLQKNMTKYDLILSDTYNSFISVPSHMTTKEFNNLTKNRLNEGGIYATIFVSAKSGPESLFFQSMLKTFIETFPNYYVFNAEAASTNDAQNIMLIGINSEIRISEKELQSQLSKINDGYLYSQRLVQQPENLITNNVPILTDNFAPTEKLMMPLMKNYFPKFAQFYYTIF